MSKVTIKHSEVSVLSDLQVPIFFKYKSDSNLYALIKDSASSLSTYIVICIDNGHVQSGTNKSIESFLKSKPDSISILDIEINTKESR